MKKVFKLQELDCANCAAKMEHVISQIPGVEKASVNFMMQKLTLEAAEEEMSRILDEAQKAVSKIERHCRIIF